MLNRRSKNDRLIKLVVQQICDRRLTAASRTNPTNHLDVNNDESVTAADALTAVAEAVGTPVRQISPDTNGDLKVTASDALRVNNGLAAEGENGDNNSVICIFRIDGGSNRADVEGDDHIDALAVDVTTVQADQLDADQFERRSNVINPQSLVDQVFSNNGTFIS